MLLWLDPKLAAVEPWCLKDSRLLAFWKVLALVMGAGAAWGAEGVPKALCSTLTACMPCRHNDDIDEQQDH